jgi:hypothetical protein
MARSKAACRSAGLDLWGRDFPERDQNVDAVATLDQRLRIAATTSGVALIGAQ